MNKTKILILSKIALFISFTIGILSLPKISHLLMFNSKILVIIFSCNILVKLNSRDLIESNLEIHHRLMAVLKSGIYLFFSSSFVILFFQLYAVSIRLILFTVVIMTIIEMVTHLIVYISTKSEKFLHTEFLLENRFNYLEFFLDLLIWTSLFLLVNRNDVIDFNKNYELQKNAIILTSSFLLFTSLTRKYYIPSHFHIRYRYSQLWKVLILTYLGYTLVKSQLNIFYPINIQIFLVNFFFIEILQEFFIFKIFRKKNTQDGSIHVDDVVNEYDVSLEEKEFEINELTKLMNSIIHNKQIHSEAELNEILEKILIKISLKLTI